MLPLDDLNDKDLQSFEAKGIRVRTKLHSLAAYSHPIHMLILEVTLGRRTYSKKHFTVKFIQTSNSEMYQDGIVWRNRANIQESSLVCEASVPKGSQGSKFALFLRKGGT